MEWNVAKFRKSGPPHQVQFSDEDGANIKPPAPHGRFNARRSYQHDAQASGSFACSPTRLRVVLVFSPDKVEMELFLSLQQRYITRLFKVTISGQRFGNLPVLHDEKGNAVGQRPMFVRPSIV